MSITKEVRTKEVRTNEVRKSEAEWRAELTPEQYRVAREHGTERPFSSSLNAEKRDGLYHCVCCGEALFEAGTKFELRFGLAKLLRTPQPGGGWGNHRPVVSDDPHRGALQPVRGTSRACVPRRAAANRIALLHERRGAEIRAEGLTPLNGRVVMFQAAEI